MHISSTIRTSCFVAVLAVSLSSCGGSAHDDAATASPPAPIVTVRVAAVSTGPMDRSVTAYGRTDALRKERISAPLAGRIVRLSAFEGTRVGRGDELAVILTKESQAALLGAQNMVRSASTTEQRAEAERMLALARSSEQRVTLTAWFDGVVAARAVSEGELVSENQELFSVIDPSTIILFAEIPLRDVAALRIGNTARVLFPALGTTAFPAQLRALSPQATNEGQTVRARFDFGALDAGQRAQLRTGMSATVIVRTGTVPDACIVPREAVVRNDENNTYTIVTITPDSLAVHVPVRVGMSTDSTVQIDGPGVRPGLPVITDGNYTIADSARVRVAERTGR